MDTAVKTDYLTVEDYLQGEEHSDVRHEYIGGQVFAMAGGSEVHNLICGNFFAAVHAHLRGSSCKVYIADLKARLYVGGKDTFYYPDVMVVCDPRDTEALFKRFPKLVIEVLSDSTEKTDRREKFWSYTQIESLEEYVLIDQGKIEVTVFRRRNGWKAERFTSASDSIRLISVDLELSVRDLYYQTGLV